MSDGGELPPSTLHAAEVSGAIQRQQEPSQQQQELSATAEPAPAVSPVTDNGDEQQVGVARRLNEMTKGASA